jgi:3-phenylpropionate/trans-cinnamate dioxygenase ferredoxin reductase subunit
VTDSRGVVIVGASLAGTTTAEALRRDGYRGSITMIGEESHLPYSRPPLSKQVLGGSWATTPGLLRPEQFAALGVDLQRGRRATGVDIASRTIAAEGSRFAYEHLVLACGVRARHLDNLAGLRGVHVVRGVDDVFALRRSMRGARRVAVVGAGVLGCEIAAASAAAGLDVTLVGRTSLPRVAGTGDHVSVRIAEVLRAGGVTLRMGVEVVEALGTVDVAGLVLSDGSVVAADLVIAAIGTAPNVEWLDGAELDLTDGVLCDADGLAAPNCYAAGDVARWRDPVTGDARRIEHQATAIEQALAVARHIATGEGSAPIAPFFWSELFGNKILVHGVLHPDVPLTVLAGDPEGPAFVATTLRDGRATGVIGWNMPREFRQHRARMIQPVGQLAGA